MANYDFAHMKIETNVPPGVGAEVTLAAMDQYQRITMGQYVQRFVLECRHNPEMRAKVKAKEAELRASGWYDAHPPTGGNL